MEMGVRHHLEGTILAISVQRYNVSIHSWELFCLQLFVKMFFPHPFNLWFHEATMKILIVLVHCFKASWLKYKAHLSNNSNNKIDNRIIATSVIQQLTPKGRETPPCNSGRLVKMEWDGPPLEGSSSFHASVEKTLTSMIIYDMGVGGVTKCRASQKDLQCMDKLIWDKSRYKSWVDGWNINIVSKIINTL